MRSLDPKDLPSSLWNRQERVLLIPPILSEAYRRLVQKLNIQQDALSDGGKSPAGGGSKKETDEYFLQRFDGSCARTMLAILDPTSELGPISNSLIFVMSQDTVCITDAPCGTGAATLSLLCSIAQLRKEEVLPRQPLSVKFVGGELSSTAQDYAKKLFLEVQGFLEEQAIFVEEQRFISWNVIDPITTSRLVKESTLLSQDSSAHLIMIANFSDFLKRDSKRKKAENQLREIFTYASGKRNSFAIWLEPQTKAVVGLSGIAQWIKKLFGGPWNLFGQLDIGLTNEKPVYTTKAKFISLQKADIKPMARLAALLITLREEL